MGCKFPTDPQKRTYFKWTCYLNQPSMFSRYSLVFRELLSPLDSVCFQILKGRLVEVPYEPICRDCSMYFSITASLLDFCFHPKDHWTLKTGYFEDPTPAIQVQTLPLEGPRSLGQICFPQPFPVPFQKPARDVYVSSAAPPGGLPTAKSLTEIPGIWPRGSGQSRG